MGIKVSIPFKRETAFKPGQQEVKLNDWAQVSIPFKRETAFKLDMPYDIHVVSEKFQFPSNGKLHSNPKYC